MRSLPLEVAHDINAIQPTLKTMVENGCWPGFQVDPEAGSPDEIRSKVEASMRVYMPDFSFNVRTASGQFPDADKVRHLVIAVFWLLV